VGNTAGLRGTLETRWGSVSADYAYTLRLNYLFVPPSVIVFPNDDATFRGNDINNHTLALRMVPRW